MKISAARKDCEGGGMTPAHNFQQVSRIAARIKAGLDKLFGLGPSCGAMIKQQLHNIRNLFPQRRQLV